MAETDAALPAAGLARVPARPGPARPA